tara:strand:- start:7890 stop:8324 length:435 start_codon:yes stop_codon:yes gene_type:complete
MATGSYIINRAFSKLGIKAAETDIEASEMQDGLDALNDMLESWEPIYQLGFIRLESETEEVRAPSFANSAIITSLAIYLSGEYNQTPKESLAIEAINSKRDLDIAILKPIRVAFPDTLPMGSGNHDISVIDNERFFNEDKETNF